MHCTKVIKKIECEFNEIHVDGRSLKTFSADNFELNLLLLYLDSMMSNKSPQCAETIEYSVQTSRWRKTLIDKLYSIVDGFKRHIDAVIHEITEEFEALKC